MAGPSAAVLIDWLQDWLETETRRGTPFHVARRRFNEAGPLLVSLTNAVAAARAADLGVLDVMDYAAAQEAEWGRPGAI